MNTSHKLTAALAALAFLSASALSLAPSASAQVPPAPPLAGQHPGERHPELRRALRTLARTETDLRRANRDFGGHRQKAADLCHQAQQEVQLALQSDRN